MTTTNLAREYAREWLERAKWWRAYGDRAAMRNCALMFRWFNEEQWKQWEAA